jgi:hypothetical protein
MVHARVPALGAALSFCLLSQAAPAGEQPRVPESRVVIVGMYHLSNPGLDLNSVKAVDVLTPDRQAQLQAITDALARFEPTVVGVEWPADTVDERYPKYLAGTLPESRNEVVQLGFRLARQRGLKHVYGLDVDGDFPFEAVQNWAKANGQTAEIERLLALGQKETSEITALQEKSTIGAILRHMNQPEAVAANYSFYPPLLRMGNGNDQPGAALLSTWQARNVAICARLVQALKPGDRAVVFFGQGHVFLLNQCLDTMPGIRRENALDYLPQ